MGCKSADSVSATKGDDSIFSARCEPIDRGFIVHLCAPIRRAAIGKGGVGVKTICTAYLGSFTGLSHQGDARAPCLPSSDAALCAEDITAPSVSDLVMVTQYV